MNVNTGLQVPFCTGRNVPATEIPANACDCHHHIYDPVRFPYRATDTRNQPPATVDCYRLLQKKLGVTRNVIVEPSAYGTDNRCTLDALRVMGKENTRAVVVLDRSTSDEEIRQMHELGVRGLRFNINSGGGPEALDEIEELAARVAPYHWSVAFWMSADLAVSMEDFLRNLPCDVVFDHRGHIPAEAGTAHPAFAAICRLMEEGKAWVKLSGLYQDTRCADYADTIAVGKAYVAAVRTGWYGVRTGRIRISTIRSWICQMTPTCWMH